MSEDTYKMLTAFSGMGNFMREKLEGLTFSGMQDTPTGYESGKYLISTASGVEWTDAPAGGGGGSSSITSYDSVASLPASQEVGTLATVGCDLYIACDGGEWQRVLKDGEQTSVSDDEKFPACVTTINDQIMYSSYRDAFIEDNKADVFKKAYNGDPQTVIHEVCVHTIDSKNIARIDDGPDNIYKFGLFYGNTGVDITAIPKDNDVVFDRWESSTSQDVFGDPNQQNTTLQVSENMDIHAYFAGYTVAETLDMGTTYTNANTIAVAGNTLIAGYYPGKQVIIWEIQENGSLLFKQRLGSGNNSQFGIAANLNETGDKIIVSDYLQQVQRVYLYVKNSDGIFEQKSSVWRGEYAFSTDVAWVGNKIYCSSYQYFTCWVYDVDPLNYNFTLDQQLYYNPQSFSTGSTSSWGFGNKHDVFGNLWVVAGIDSINIANYNAGTDKWEINESESFNFTSAVNTSINNGATLVQAGNFLNDVIIQDYDNIFVSSAHSFSVDGLIKAGAVFKFQKQEGQWVHVQTFTSRTPVADSHFGLAIDVKGNQLFVYDYLPNKITIINI